VKASIPPVIGAFLPYRTLIHLPTRFKHFNNDKIAGLAYVDDDHIEILAIMAQKPGTGQFREFIQQLKEHYSTIRFWVMLNDTLAAKLAEYGFMRGKDLDEYGEFTDCMDWRKPE